MGLESWTDLDDLNDFAFSVVPICGEVMSNQLEGQRKGKKKSRRSPESLWLPLPILTFLVLSE